MMRATTRGNKQVCVLFIDVDPLQGIPNDSLGHSIGDEVLWCQRVS